jgi:predicted nucleic-acid-binding Zn-ribbon protein
MGLSAEDFFRFLEELHERRYYCPFCGHENSAAFAEDEEKPDRGVAEFRLVPVASEHHQEFYGVCCVKCGYTTFFAGDIVRAWLRKRAGGA